MIEIQEGTLTLEQEMEEKYTEIVKKGCWTSRLISERKWQTNQDNVPLDWMCRDYNIHDMIKQINDRIFTASNLE